MTPKPVAKVNGFKVNPEILFIYLFFNTDDNHC